jgi:hypothetical protein
VCPFGRLERFPALVARSARMLGAGEDVRMARLELVRDRPGDVVERKLAGFSAMRDWKITWNSRSPSSSRISARSPRATASATS